MYAVPSNIFTYTDDLFCVINEQGIIIKINDGFGKTLGYEDGEAIGKDLFELMHHSDKDHVEELLNRAREDNASIFAETQVRGKSGRFFSISWSMTHNRTEKVIFALGVYHPENSLMPDPGNIDGKIQDVIQSFNEGFLMLDESWNIVSFNPAFQAMTGLSTASLTNADVRKLKSFHITSEIEAAFLCATAENIQSQVQYAEEETGRWLRLNIYPHRDNQLIVFIRDITSLKIPQLVLALEKKVLEMNALQPTSLPPIVETLIDGIETIFPEMICTVLEIDDEQERMYHLAAPSLPHEFKLGIDGHRIGPLVGTCGAAAYHRRQMIDTHIDQSAAWKDFKYLVQPLGLKACWSTPVISSSSSKVLAVLGTYYRKPREPKKGEQQIIERTVNILRVLIESKKNIEHVNHQNERLQEIASISSHELRRPVATIMGLVGLFQSLDEGNSINSEIISHLKTTAYELDDVIHRIVKKTLEI